MALVVYSGAVAVIALYALIEIHYAIKRQILEKIYTSITIALLALGLVLPVVSRANMTNEILAALYLLIALLGIVTLLRRDSRNTVTIWIQRNGKTYHLNIWSAKDQDVTYKDFEQSITSKVQVERTKSPMYANGFYYEQLTATQTDTIEKLLRDICWNNVWRYEVKDL